MIHARSASGLANIDNVHVRDGAGLSTIGTVKVRGSSGLSIVHTVGGGLVTPDYVSGYGASSAPIFIISDSVTITSVPAGATIVWHIDNVSVTAVPPNGATVAFRAKLGSGASITATAYATVNGTDTNTVTIYLENGGID